MTVVVEEEDNLESMSMYEEGKRMQQTEVKEQNLWWNRKKNLGMLPRLGSIQESSDILSRGNSQTR
jgi:hypothetical protein